jgi:hypothetical protein
MNGSLDVYAMGNPALCSMVLAAYAHGHFAAAQNWPQMPTMLIPVPLVLSSRIARTFKQTNRTTGLLEWLSRFPFVASVAAPRIRETVQLSREALLFGVRYDVLRLDVDGRFSVDSRIIRRAKNESIIRIRPYLLSAMRLGAWVGEVHSTATVFHSLGLTP